MGKHGLPIFYACKESLVIEASCFEQNLFRYLPIFYLAEGIQSKGAICWGNSKFGMVLNKNLQCD